MKYSNLILSFSMVLINSLFFSSCDRKETTEYVTVNLQMPFFEYPDFSQSGSQTGQQGVFLSAINQLSISAPLTISEINCFGIMVSGPEPYLNRTTCPIVDADENPVQAAKTVGIIRGLIPSGGNLSLSVPAGSQRKFSLVGFKAEPLLACMNLNSPFYSDDFISQAFLIGDSAAVDLQPGTEVKVPIKIATAGTPITSASPRVGDCAGPDAPSNQNQIIANQARITKDFFPYNQFLESSCNAINIEFVDSLGRNGLTQNTQNVILEQATVTGSTVSSYGPFAMYTDSTCTTTLPTEFTLQPFLRNFTVFFMAPSAGSINGFKFRLKPGTTQPSTYPESISETFSVQFGNTGTLEVLGTRRLVPDMCYDMQGVFRTVNKNLLTGDAYTVTLPDIEGLVFDGKDCLSSPLTNGTTQNITAASDFNFSIRYTQDTFTESFFSLTPSIPAASNSVTTKYNVKVVGGSRNPTFLRPEVPQTLPTSIGCYGPFQTLVENERGGAIVTDGEITVSFLSGAPGNIGIFNNNLCNQIYAKDFADDYRRSFYIGVSGTAVVSNTTVTLRSSGLIDHPDSLTSAVQQTVSLTTTTQITFK